MVGTPNFASPWKPSCRDPLRRPYPHGRRYCGPLSRHLPPVHDYQTPLSHWDGCCLGFYPGGKKSREAVQVQGTLRRLEETVPQLPDGHSPGGDRGLRHSHTPSGGRSASSPYCGKSRVTNRRDAALCAVFVCVNPEGSPPSSELPAWNFVGSADSHRPVRTASLPTWVTRGVTQTHFLWRAWNTLLIGGSKGDRWKSRKKPGSIKSQARSSKMMTYPVSFVLGL